MAENTNIEWCDHTFNPWFGCTKVSPGCDHCYAEARMDTRLHRVNWGPGQPRVRTKTWGDPVKWNEQAFFECPDCGLRGTSRDMGDEPKTCKHLDAKPARARVFCASLADVFDNEVPAEWRADLFRLIRKTPNLDWLLLTKRIGNAHEMMVDAIEHELDMGVDPAFDNVPWPNVWIGATIVNREEMLRDGPKLMAVPARVRFWSAEPLLGDLGDIPPELIPDWGIAGGESGANARPMHPTWPRNMRDQFVAAGRAFLFKQWGEWAPADPIPGVRFGEEIRTGKVLHLHAPGNPEGYFRRGDAHVRCVGKKAAGRLLDGVTHDGFPA